MLVDFEVKIEVNFWRVQLFGLDLVKKFLGEIECL